MRKWHKPVIYIYIYMYNFCNNLRDNTLKPFTIFPIRCKQLCFSSSYLESIKIWWLIWRFSFVVKKFTYVWYVFLSYILTTVMQEEVMFSPLFVYLFVCLSICLQDISKSIGSIFMYVCFPAIMHTRPRTNSLKFGWIWLKIKRNIYKNLFVIFSI